MLIYMNYIMVPLELFSAILCFNITFIYKKPFNLLILFILPEFYLYLNIIFF